MKRTRIALAVLTLLVLSLCLCACGNAQEKMDALAGTYTITITDSEDRFMELMGSIDAYDQEIALADKNSLQYVQLVTFDAKGNYSFSYDVEATKQCTRRFYEGYFDALYAGRTTLNTAYETTFDAMTKAEFQQFFAEIYEQTDYAALLTALTENAYDYEALETPWETGTYSIRSNRIYCTITGETDAEYMTYTLEGNTLTLVYADMREVYQKVSA